MKHRDRLDVKKPTQTVGELYPVLLAKDGQIIDGYHRIDEDPDWKTETLEHIDTEEKLLIARAVSNWHRRTVTYEEKKEWINGLAQIYIDDGLKVYEKYQGSQGGPPVNEVMQRLMVELGVCRQTICKYLDKKYKQTGKGGNQGGPRVPASQSIQTLANNRPRLAGDLVARHEKEIRVKLLHDEGFRRDILHMMEMEALTANEEEDPEVDALNTQSFNNLVFQYQDGLRELGANPFSNAFTIKDRNILVKYGIIEHRTKTFRVFALTDDALKALLTIDA